MTRQRIDRNQAPAAEAADRSQAEYYRCLLAEHRTEIDRAIVKYQSAIAEQKSRGSTNGARELGRALRQAERERQAVDRMIDALDRRFPGAVLPGTPTPPPVEVVHPDGRSLLSISQKRRTDAAARHHHESWVG